MTKVKRKWKKLKRERNAAVEDLETILFYGAQNIDTCKFCKSQECYVRGGTLLCRPVWRGVQGEGIGER